ncbi:Tad domain-containing protein [Streptomyces sp. ODS28]|uniref:Tad domain-containing protein n=1 Tax=Streptomyces sp. ODS28 TaxID=3136688 RepID=UPI0031E6408E
MTRSGAAPSRLRAAAAAARRVVRDDRGSGAGAMLIFAVLFMALLGFVVDGGLSISKRERAADIAEQAARYAAQDIDTEKLRENPGKNAPIIYKNCPQRVARFAEQSGLSGADVAASGCLSANAQQVQVRVRLTYRPVLTGMFYNAPLEVYGTATAESVTG